MVAITAKARRTFECLALRQARILDLCKQASFEPSHDTFKKPCIGLYMQGPASDRCSRGSRACKTRTLKKSASIAKSVTSCTRSTTAPLHPLPYESVSDSDQVESVLCIVAQVVSTPSVLFTMSSCPPYAPFFGFAGVASSVSIH